MRSEVDPLAPRMWSECTLRQKHRYLLSAKVFNNLEETITVAENSLSWSGLYNGLFHLIGG